MRMLDAFIIEEIKRRESEREKLERQRPKLEIPRHDRDDDDEADVVVDELLGSVRCACGGTVEAARAALQRRHPMLNLLGGFHHAAPSRGVGFCAVNDVAVAIAALRAEGFTGRVAVIDLDA